MDNLSLHDYWLKFLDNDKQAFSVIYKGYVDGLFSYGIGMGYSAALCEDAIQDIFYKIYITKEKLHNIRNFKFYVFRTFKNRLIDLERKNKPLLVLDDFKDMPFSVDITILDDMVNEEEGKMLKHKIETFLNLLTDRQREAIYLRYMQDMDYDEIAQLMNMHIESVRKIVYRGLESIRKNVSGTSTIFFIIAIYSLYVK